MKRCEKEIDSGWKLAKKKLLIREYLPGPEFEGKEGKQAVGTGQFNVPFALEGGPPIFGGVIATTLAPCVAPYGADCACQSPVGSRFVSPVVVLDWL